MISNSYSPGLHQLLTLHVECVEKLMDSHGFIKQSHLLIGKYELEQIGIVAHNFENKSFTVAICLKESHICIHTWPEFKLLTLDVYLCNYVQDNSWKVRAISGDFIDYFQATVLKDIEINR